MSILNKIWGSIASISTFLYRDVAMGIFDLVFARHCPVCGEEMVRGQRFVCTACRLDAPTTNFSRDRYNPMAERVRSLRPEIEHASSLLFYISGSRWRKLIHNIKYHSQPYLGYELGEWLGGELANSPIYANIDCVVAVPLHPFRQIWRGYNQSDHIAHGVAKVLGAKHIHRTVSRSRYNSPQVHTHRDERWRNVENLFRVREARHLAGRNILLVDDVFTTGATVMSCAEAILDAVPDCRLWIASVAVSNREFGYGQD